MPFPIPFSPPLTQWSKMAGMTHAYKRRYIVIMPHRACPPGSTRNAASGLPSTAGPLQRERRQLWVVADQKSLIPKCRMWLDGASSYIAAGDGLEAILVRPFPV